MALAAAAAGATVTAAASEPRLISQRNQSFEPRAVEVERGETLRIANDDPFLHHVYTESPRFSFDSGEQRPGQTIQVRFDRPGEYTLQCAIHLKMKLRVVVKP